MSAPLLQVSGLRMAFGAVVAVDDVSLTIPAGQVVGIIGANGAGKTTFVNMVTGWLSPTSGLMRLEGRNIAGLPPRAMAQLGVTRSFQIPQVFLSLTVMENIALAHGLAENALLRLCRPLMTAQRLQQCVATLLRFGLQQWAQRPVAELPQGARKLLDIAMALTRKPRLLLLDEPTSGVAREEKFGVMDQVFQAIAGTGVTVLFVEHDMDVVVRYVSRVIAFVQGRIVADGSCDAVLSDESVRKHVIGSTLKPGQPA